MSKLFNMDGSPMPPPGKGAGTVNVNILTQPSLRCETCDGVIFRPVTVFKRISKVLIGAPEDQIAPIQLYQCTACDSILTDLLPSPDHLSLLLA